MEFLIYSGTAVLCITLETLKKFNNIKKLAQKGYKLDEFKIKKQDYFKLTLSLIPLVNLALITKNIKEIKNKNKQISKLESNIIPLTKEEKNVFQNNPSLLNAIKLNINNISLPNSVLIYMSNDEENRIYYKKENNNCIIISTIGPISKEPKTRQYKKLEKELNILYFEKENKNKPNNINLKEQKNYNNKNLSLNNYSNNLVEDKQKVYKKIIMNR